MLRVLAGQPIPPGTRIVTFVARGLESMRGFDIFMQLAARILRERVGLRPFRKTGVRLEREKLSDRRTVIHNYGHGGSGFTLSWGCAENVFRLYSQ